MKIIPLKKDDGLVKIEEIEIGHCFRKLHCNLVFQCLHLSGVGTKQEYVPASCLHDGEVKYIKFGTMVKPVTIEGHEVKG